MSSVKVTKEYIKFKDNSKMSGIFPGIGMVMFWPGDVNNIPDGYLICNGDILDKEETVNSYIAKAQNRNHWIEHDGMLWKKDPLWDSPYPKYKIPTLKDAISKYYDEYYELCCAIDKNLCWWVDTKDLNSELHCLEMLDFCGFKDPQFVKMKKNAGGSI